MKRVILAVPAFLVCALPALAGEQNAREFERNCHDYTQSPDAQAAACTQLLPLYGDRLVTIGLRALAHLARGTAYRRSGDAMRADADFQEAIRLDSIPLQSGSMEALLYNDRCWVRAIAGLEPDLALADCNKAIELRPNFTAALDSRAFLHLKHGRYREAMADYEAVLKDSPKDPYSVFGRGVAKLKNGDASGGNADIAAAEALQKGLREEFAAYGVTP